MFTAVERSLASIQRVIYLLDRSLAPRPKVKAFQRAAEIVGSLGEDELCAAVNDGSLYALDGIGPSTGSVIADAVLDRPSAYLEKLEDSTTLDIGEGATIRAALRGDCHMHTTWSDGAASISEMAANAERLGHEYLVITDHSPRLTIAHGLNPERLAAQLEEIAVLNAAGGIRILTGMEVDILEDGSLDLPESLLAELDVVVASVHSKLAMESSAMTRRMVLAAASPHVDILGHCTGRQIVGTKRAPSTFDPDVVFAACAQYSTAVEINCRPERQDPPEELLDLAIEWNCLFSIDTDAHSPGQMEWQASGCDKAARHQIPAERIINTWTAENLLDWTAHR
jgi:putative hydrolase